MFIGLLKKCEEPECSKTYHILCAYLNRIYFNVTDQNSEKEKLRFNGLNVKTYCFEHTPSHIAKTRSLMKQIYYRRYAINYDNTSNLNYDEFCLRYAIEAFSLKFSIYK